MRFSGSVAAGECSATPRVTVLLPVHNGADYLREAIDSVLAQNVHEL
jgi:glycosyltransferase involved in cell wall biosynthesis